ncbi:peptide chain release factor N(5)-glutamine methyltransferase [Puniceicoccales bacterium CK1056]|uniref:Release factor glutamine methyltransferase n=1 Tax=Oceanipulchritudo coccoides TaxID=2706888 RepID=A0A6B2LZ99_9BACT|nr:peptide chain release factor N(5)-glutamine methyltransferase [Oceanipulchritudo coccoides]NDV61978.1 peptide chain release factor N(5)-glutamine methyltransferase [Oceanipulchritudo coccoides]
MQQVVEVLKKTESFFDRSGIESPKVEAEWLLASVLDCKRLELYLQWDKPLQEDLLEQLRPLVKRRASGEPLQYVLGYSEFHDIRIAVAPGVLIPRPETELLVEFILAHLREIDSPRIVDLGTGSGAIALALAKALPRARILAVEKSSDALVQARQNAETLGLRERVAFRSGDWLKDLSFEADCIVSNPPYLTEEEWQAARPEVKEYEPKDALVAADGGTGDLRKIVRDAGDRLAPNGLLALEMGIDHGPTMSALARDYGYGEVLVKNDDSGRERFLFARKG